MNLPNPQMLADSQAILTFSQAISLVANKFVNEHEIQPEEKQILKDYLSDNISASNKIIGRLEGILG